MRLLILLAALMVFSAGAFAASGDKPNQIVLQFRNVSSATKPSCTAGELKYNRKFIFLCAQTNAWKRYSGASF